jgi:hypothetical protein
VLLVICLAGLLGSADVAAAATGSAGRAVRPVIVSIKAVRVDARAVGETVLISIRVRHATRCVVSDGRTLASVACGSGKASATMVPLPAVNQPLTYSVIASSETGAVLMTLHVPAAVISAPAPAPSPAAPVATAQVVPQPSVPGLGTCSPGSDCDYGPIGATYQQYGNVGPANFGDCTFAAAADWEQIVAGADPDSQLIENQFLAAGGTPDGGLSIEGLWVYWQQQGIAGIVASGVQSYGTDQATLQGLVRSNGAVIGELQFGPGGAVAQFAVPPGYHVLVVDGFTPVGPLVVSWGLTLQMTWQQWNSEAIGVWTVTAAPAA